MRSVVAMRIRAAGAAVVAASFMFGGINLGSAAASTTTPVPYAPTVNPSLATMNATGDHALGSTVAANEPGSGTRPPAPSTIQTNPTLKGLDVSGWQGNINWPAVSSAGAKFAYVKATEGITFASSYFGQQYNGAYNIGLVRGAYHFARPDKSTAAAQAAFFLANGGGWNNDGRTLPPLLDIEYNPVSGAPTCYGFSMAKMVAWITNFSNAVLASTGRRPAIYSTTNWWIKCTGNTPNLSLNPLFIANWTGTPTPLPAGWTDWNIWQNGHTGTFPGDEDVFNGDATALTRLAVDANAPVSRIAGTSSYSISAAVSASQFLPGVSVAYVATAATFPNALSAQALAGHANGPVLLVSGTSIPASVGLELTRLQPQQIVVLGGTSSVSASVAVQLQAYTVGAVTRIAGADRYATSALASATFDPGVPVAYIATGLDYSEAMAGGALAAAATGGPILQVPGTSIPTVIKQELSRLKPAQIVVLGSTSSVTAKVQTQLQAYTLGTVTRLSGHGRYATSAAISATVAPATAIAYIVNGASFADALSVGPVAGINAGRILVVQGNSIPASVAAELLRLQPTRIVVIGGTSSITAHVESLLHQYVH